MEPIQKRKSGLKAKASLDPTVLDAETARETARLLVLAMRQQLQEIENEEEMGEMDTDPSYVELDSDIFNLVGADSAQGGMRLGRSGKGIAASVGGKDIPPTFLSQWATEYGIDPQVIVDILKEEAAAPTDAMEFTTALKKRRDNKNRVAQEPVKKDWGRGMSDKEVSKTGGIFSRLFGL